MKFMLRLFELKIASIRSLKLDDRARLLGLWSQIKGLTTIAGVKFFGSGDRLRPIEGVDQLVKEFRKRKVESYSFADVRNITEAESSLRWSVGIRRALVTVSLVCEVPPERFEKLMSEFISVNEVLLTSIMDSEIGVPFSFLVIPSLRFKLQRPPRFFGRFAANSIVDLIHLKSAYKPEEQEIINQLKNADLTIDAKRVIKGDLLIVKWGDINEQSAETILSQRYCWYAERGNLPVDSSFNSIGDKEFALWNAIPTQELTAYSPFNKKGSKAIVFDEPDEELIEVLEKLQQILVSGKTIEGYQINEITLIVPSRESAIILHHLASHYQMRVVYVGEDDKFWDPFPLEYEPV